MGNCVLSIGWDDDSKHNSRNLQTFADLCEKYGWHARFHSVQFAANAKCGVEFGGASLLFWSRNRIIRKMHEFGLHVTDRMLGQGVWYHVEFQNM